MTDVITWTPFEGLVIDARTPSKKRREEKG
jgi:hypothetical protein